MVKKLLVVLGLFSFMVLPLTYAQDQTLGVDLLGSFGRGFAVGEKISFSGTVRPVYDLGLPVNVGILYQGGPGVPTDWAVLLDRRIATFTFGPDTSTLKLSVKTGTYLREGADLADTWYAATFDYKPNLLKGGVWQHLSVIFEPSIRLINHKPDYAMIQTGARIAF